jgi:hypothetical protein
MKIRMRYLMFLAAGVVIALLVAVAVTVFQTYGRTQIQFDIRQNQKIIALSTYAEPPQFAIWIENAVTRELKTVYITRRTGSGDWEGKANVPVSLPRWYELFRGKNTAHKVIVDDKYSAVTGATPKEDYFSVRIEVRPGTSWICWIEMNLAGDYNEAWPEIDLQSLSGDEFACGQPALLYKAEITAGENAEYAAEIAAMSVWENGVSIMEPVGPGITTAKLVFDTIRISVIRPKPRFEKKYEIRD